MRAWSAVGKMLSGESVRLRWGAGLRVAVPGGILGWGLLLRASLLAANRFHPDEALYSTWGLLIATGRDPTLSTVPLDKPPLFFYVQALFFMIFGQGEAAARLPNLCASVAAIGLLYALAARLYGRRTAALAAGLLACSPFDIQYAPTAFTDPLMVALGLGACLCAAHECLLGAGILLGLATLTKPTALLFLPLVLALMPRQMGYWLRTLAGFAVVGMLGVGWDLGLRSGTSGFVAAGIMHYGALALVTSALWASRCAAWLAHAQYLTASQTLNIALLAGVPLLLVWGWWRRCRGWYYDLLLALWVMGMVAVHTMASFSLWDRYLLPLAPVTALLLARIFTLPCGLLQSAQPLRWRAIAGLFGTIFLVVVLWVPVRGALRYAYPVGGDHGTYQGLDAVAAFLRGEAAPGSIVYQHGLGWELGYYLFGARLEIQHYEEPGYVLATALAQAARQQYLVAPAWAPATDVALAMQQRGWHLAEIYRTYRPDGSVSFLVYEVDVMRDA